MIVHEHVSGADPARLEPGLLGGLTQRGGHRVLMAVAGPAGQPPGIPVMAPPRPMLEQDADGTMVVD